LVIGLITTIWGCRKTKAAAKNGNFPPTKNETNLNCSPAKNYLKMSRKLVSVKQQKISGPNLGHNPHAH
jgi:hypothetical protein